MNDDQLVNWLKLCKVKGLGPKKIKDLIEQFEGIDNLFKAPPSQLLRTRFLNEEIIKRFEQLKEASSENFYNVINQCNENKIKIMTFLDDDYPKKLKYVSYPPLTLFLKGNVNLLNAKKIAIVGSRNASEEAKKWTSDIAKTITDNNFVVISGGAIGIDSAAHQGSLDITDGKTICVLGSGFFKMFPEQNIPMYNKIAKNGLLISEHLPNFPGDRIALIQRNRITSGLSDGLIMAASGARGGSMVQTKMAFEQRVPIFIPKLSLNLKPTEGLKQIKEEWGGIEINSASDVLDLLNKQQQALEKDETVQKSLLV